MDYKGSTTKYKKQYKKTCTGFYFENFKIKDTEEYLYYIKFKKKKKYINTYIIIWNKDIDKTNILCTKWSLTSETFSLKIKILWWTIWVGFY